MPLLLLALLMICSEVLCFRQEWTKFVAKRTIDRIHNPTYQEFKKNYFDRNEPVIITGGMTNWLIEDPRWTDEGLERLCGERVVPIRVITSSSKALSRGNHVKVEMKFAEYLRKYQTQPAPHSLAECRANGDSCPAETSCLYYAAGVVLKDHLPELLAWVKEPKYLKLHSVQAMAISPRMYFGAGGQSIPVHYDEVENLLHLVDGQKNVTLFSPLNDVRRVLYLGDSNVDSYNWSPVEINSADWEQTHPHFKDAVPIRFTLNPGEILYIPIFWFHHVQSGNERSLSINFWYKGDAGKIKAIKPLLYPKKQPEAKKQKSSQDEAKPVDEDVPLTFS